MLCLKALMKQDYGFRKLLDEPGFLQRIALNLDTAESRTRVTVMQMMALAASNPSGGATLVLDAFHHYSGVKQERTRFQHVTEELDITTDDGYIIAALQCFLAIVDNAADLNTMLYFQMDLERAGLNDVLPKLARHGNVTVARLSRNYDQKLLNVDELMVQRDRTATKLEETSERLNALETTVASVTQQRDELRELHKEAQVRATDLSGKVDVYLKEIETMAMQMEEMSIKLQEQTILMQDQEKQLKEVEEHAMRTAEQLRQQQLAFKRHTARAVHALEQREGGPTGGEGLPVPPDAPDMLPPPPAPPLLAPPPPAPPMPGTGIGVPPAPPLPPHMNPGADAGGVPAPPPLMQYGYAPPGMKPKRRITPNVPLPIFNWVPLRKVTNTIFEELDDEAILNEMDFRDVGWEKTERGEDGRPFAWKRLAADRQHSRSPPPFCLFTFLIFLSLSLPSPAPSLNLNSRSRRGESWRSATLRASARSSSALLKATARRTV
jgi:hypothetical protein